VVPEDQMVEALVEWAEFINEHGIERALSKADLSAAQAAAEADRAVLLEEQGADANDSEQRVELIHKRADHAR
jgi:(E)-4-hydroxy-3-methylbut-2-enyl-diphosphate synthase